jgi:hypothetical protein
MLNGWQHNGSFVIKFSQDTNPDAGRLSGRIEHVASGETTRFESENELLAFLSSILKRVRTEFQDAKTLVEEVPANDQTNL